VCSEQLPTADQQGVALADSGVPDLITHPFLAASLSVFHPFFARVQLMISLFGSLAFREKKKKKM